MIRNPFITSGYVSADYFCDRHQKSERLVREILVSWISKAICLPLS